MTQFIMKRLHYGFDSLRNPEKNLRPMFRDIFLTLVENHEEVFLIPQDALHSHQLAGVLGAPEEAGDRMYLDLRRTYEKPPLFEYESNVMVIQ